MMPRAITGTGVAFPHLGSFRAALLLALALTASGATRLRAATDVWLDVDPGTGVGDIDDALMMIQCFHSPELVVRGVSVVFGNAPLPHGLKVAQTVCGRFGPAWLEPAAGAGQASQLGQETAATTALSRALSERKLTILAVGPVTNVATLLMREPQLAERMERIVVVAGRRPGQKFVSSEQQKLPHRDFNFELDPQAMQVLVDSAVPLVLAPWEVSSQVWITQADLDQLAGSGGSGQWIAQTSGYWIRLWRERTSPEGFNPFDSLAAAWLTHPELIESQVLPVAICRLPDDRQQASPGDPPRTKPYLLVAPCEELEALPSVENLSSEGLVENAPRSPSQTREVTYCFRPHAKLKAVLLSRLAGAASDRPAIADEK